MAGSGLLLDDEPSPVETVNLRGESPVVIVCEHAGRRIPRQLGDMGLSDEDRGRHIAWDIGAGALSRKLAERLDAALITQTYSRLVCDCNRETHVPSFIPEISERTRIPANEGLSAAEREARIDAIYRPLHDRIRDELDARAAQGRPTVFLSMHSFTPVFMDQARAMHVGLLYDRDPRLAHLAGSILRGDSDLVVTDNEPLRARLGPRLHRAGAWRAPRHPVARDRAAPGSDRRARRSGRLGGTPGAGAREERRSSSARGGLTRSCGAPPQRMASAVITSLRSMVWKVSKVALMPSPSERCPKSPR